MTKLPKCPAHKGLKAPSPKVVQIHFHVIRCTATLAQGRSPGEKLAGSRRSVSGYLPWYSCCRGGTRSKPLIAPPVGTGSVGHGQSVSLPAIWHVPHMRNSQFTSRDETPMDNSLQVVPYDSPFAISKSQKLNFGGVFARLSDFLVSPTAL